MTYGWAILIIAVILGALFSLGFFNSASLAPKVSPGACIVERPYGPGTSAYATLQGTCNNELPQYVAQFNGENSITVNPYGTPAPDALLNNQPDFTITAWVYVNNYGTPNLDPAIYSEGVPDITLLFGLNANDGLTLNEWNSNLLPNNWAGFGSSVQVPLHQWVFVAGTLSDGGVNTGSSTLYLNAQSVSGNAGQEENTGGYTTHYFGIGANTGGDLGGGQSPQTWNGYIANLQIYNASLSQNAIMFIYHEGIGGVPTSLNHLVAWWPLNGNANDYSGNQNNGRNANIVYTNSWTSSYSAP